MLEFAGFHARLCRTLLTQMLEFGGPYSPLQLGLVPSMAIFSRELGSKSSGSKGKDLEVDIPGL
jgi:hypothetical protein